MSFSSNRFINFQFVGGELFNKIVMTSTAWAFESNNHALANVPEPATALLMMLGLAGLGALRYRRVS